MSDSRIVDGVRAQAVEIITRAHREGRLNDLERDIRISTAERATRVQDLDRLVRDLGVGTPSHMAAAAPERPLFTARPSAGPPVGRIIGTGVLVLVLVLTVGSIAFAAIMVNLTSSQEQGSSSMALGESGIESELHTAAGLSELVDTVRAEIGTTEVDRVYVYPDYALVTSAVPGRDDEADTRSFGLGSAEEVYTSARLILGPPVDLADIDTGEAARLLRETPSDLFTPDTEVEFVYLVVEGRGNEPTMSVYASAGPGTTGWVTWTLDGREIDRYTP